MNYQSCNGVTCVSSTKKRITTINGVEYPWVKGMTGNCTTQINEKVYIDGYELKNGKWKKTCKALFHLIF